MFGTVLITIITVMHVYVFWRGAGVPFFRHLPRKYYIAAGVCLWAVCYAGRVYGHGGAGRFARLIEFFGMTWMGIILLLFVMLFLADILTGFGFFIKKRAAHVRGIGLAIGGILSVAALIQGMRPPVKRHYEVSVPGLPAAADGTVLVILSDIHIGGLFGKRWLEARIDQVRAQKPDLIILLGDIFEGHGRPPENLLKNFQNIRAPLGCWAVLGNHESHRGSRGQSIEMLTEAGFGVLLNRWEQVLPGLVLAGVDDLTTTRRRSKRERNLIAQALAGRPEGAVLLLSHTPWMAEDAAALGAGLMLSGHTHGGQLWPFGYLVRSRYSLLGGRYEVNGMAVIVCRGTGTWGPRMRLWYPSEILRITLHPSPKP